ncbi:hypothetical protein LTR99_000264 [Exophiala xenobiotica]|uniref:N-acetyltransferase domain-containing protein n=1 Tax=Vermiconidia calcicola TaxID=1690605 RepID=A0AAV9QHS5_9PEZI|nr:hypothetical protein H2202_004624 [Exophiala xenobiotica]KAK5543904.1 hypothetical protein LTR25_001519 [Vermiconidia calcicola]KAK5548583.1 hypothetical protein LTR23_001713 [Chaetothyriales sp. CCFEE 6169]KAK5213743.1 hypothetical protein LTR41_001323 [Exophiala xenobiotica]KAK5237644.1 hypothetical protein LTR47_000736 [Exophiala xenobiotica]
MDPIIFTPRLKLTLITKAERNSPELEWLHELRSNEQATWWSIHGRQKNLEDTEKVIAGFLPVPPPPPLPTDNPNTPDKAEAEAEDEDEKTYRVVYAVHQLPTTTTSSTPPNPPLVSDRTAQPATTIATTTTTTDQSQSQTQTQTQKQSQSQPQPQVHVQNPTAAATTPTLIGLVTLTSLGANALTLPAHLTSLPPLPPTTTTTTTTTKPLTLELAYMFLPKSWGRGYATESVNAVFASCQRAAGATQHATPTPTPTQHATPTPPATHLGLSSFWSPFTSILVRAIVNQGNPASMRVMHKVGMTKTGVYELTDRRVFLAGEWRDRHSLHIFARLLF